MYSINVTTHSFCFSVTKSKSDYMWRRALCVRVLWGEVILNDLASVGLLLAPVVQVQAKWNHGSILGLLVKAGLGCTWE